MPAHKGVLPGGTSYPMPKGMPKAIGMAQWIVTGRHVHEKTNWPIGVRIAPMVMIAAVASGGALPVSGSFLCELTI